MANKNNEIDIFSMIKEDKTASIAILAIHRMHHMLMLHVFNVALFEGCETLRGRMDNRKSSPDLYSLLNRMHNSLTSLQTSLEGLSRYFPQMLYLIFIFVVLMEKSEAIVSETPCKGSQIFNPSHEKYRANTSLDILCTLYRDLQKYSKKLDLYRKDNYLNTYY